VYNPYINYLFYFFLIFFIISKHNSCQRVVQQGRDSTAQLQRHEYRASGVTSIERVGSRVSSEWGHEYRARTGQKIKCGGCEIPWDFGGVLTGFLACEWGEGAVSVCIGDPMGWGDDGESDLGGGHDCSARPR